MQQGVRDFLDFLATERKLTQNTLAAYRNDLLQLAEFLESQVSTADLYPDWSAVTQSNIVAFVLDLRQKGYVPSTIARKVAAVRSYFRYLRRTGAIHTDPTQSVSSPKVDKALPTALSSSEIGALLEQPARLRTPEAARDLAMLELLYATGVRVTELVSLNLDDLNLLSRDLRCVSRNAKVARERLVPISQGAVAALESYLSGARLQLLREASEPALFLNHRGERLTRQGFWLIVKAYARAAQIRPDTTPHTLRHSCAARMLAEGADLTSVQELLGHMSINTTQVYAQLVTKQMAAAGAGREAGQ